MQGREERSKGIEIRIADAFAIIKPTAPSFFVFVFFFFGGVGGDGCFRIQVDNKKNKTFLKPTSSTLVGMID